MGERRGTKGLELWCRRMTEGYPGVKIDNMTTSWRDGLAFCAIIHHFRPDLIDFSKLNKNNIYYNNKLAFRVAEDDLGIPALLEPEDMVEYSVPDRLSILTYLSQFYQAFAVNHKNSQTKTSTKRPPPTDLQMHMVSGTSSTPPKKAALRVSGARRDPCVKCGLPVFIAERLNVGEALYHRTCFLCARCNSQLTLANYYETENGEFCCETCPDEEKPPMINVNILSKSLSDEEKSASLKGESDIFSSKFENALEDPKDDSLRHNFTLDNVAGDAFVRARAQFMTTQVNSSNSDSDSDSSRERKPPDLPAAPIPQIVREDVTHMETMDADGINMLPSLSDSDPPSSKPTDQTPDRNELESQNAVTKDSISAKDEPALSSIKSRIKLFESNVENHHEIPKSDVNRKSLRLSQKFDKVPYAKCSEDLGLSAKQHSNESAGEDISKHSQIDTGIELDLPNESGISTIDDSGRLNYSEFSESYQADISDLNDSALLSERNESVIVLSSETSSENDSVMFAPSEIKNNSVLLNEQNESIVAISSDYSFGNDKNELFTSSGSNGDVAMASEHNESIHIISSETSSECKNDIPPLSESKPLDTDKSNEKSDPCVDKPDTSEEKLKPLPDSNDSETSQRKSAEIADIELSPSQKAENDLNPFDDDEDEENEACLPKTSKSLNPFSDTEDEEENVSKMSKSISLNPFGDTDEEEELQVKVEEPTPAPRLIIPPKSTNPFDSDDEDIETGADVPVLPPQPAVRKLIKAPKISLTPWNDDFSPVPKSRSPARYPSDASSLTGSGRKKKPAPKPPTAASCFNQDANESSVSSITSSPSQSVCHSPKPATKVRKMKKAPLPPGSSTPLKSESAENFRSSSPIDHDDLGTKPLLFRVGSAENLKSVKDEMNRNRQHSSNVQLNESPSSLPNKSTYGKWKKRKGPAPVRPIPKRRSIKILPINEIKQELELIEVQQQGLEKQGVRLEKLIRERSEVPGTTEDETLSPETEDMVLQLFDLVNEKNELFRKQAELMYLRRQHRLEEEHADVEYQIRCLMLQPELNKTDSDKAKEDELINRLVDIVERRNEIVDCLEMDRQRAADEDSSIISQLCLFTTKREDSSSPKKKFNKKDKSKPKKDKEKKSKSKNKMDIDKDIDETEAPNTKEKKKKKFNLF